MTPQELKNSILQLAIQGKLVEQRSEEGTAEELYREIQAEKQRLIMAGKIKREKPLPEITEDEKPFEIPESWIWVKLGNIIHYTMGKTPPRAESQWWGQGIPWVSIADMPENGHVQQTKEAVTDAAVSEIFGGNFTKAGTLLMSFKLTVGRVSILDIDAVHNEAIISIYPLCDNEKIMQQYLFKVLPFISQFGDSKNAIKGKTLNRTSISNMLIALPPLAEQKRIVAKIEELLPYIDRYEQAWIRLETFNQRFPDDMRKSILQLAIQGKLVEQRPEEGTGDELYREIQVEKQRLIKAGKIKAEKPLPEIAEDEKPFEIPESWKWVRLSEVIDVRDGTHDTPKYLPSGYPLITGKDFYNGFFDLSKTQYISSNDYQCISQRSKVEPYDILFSMIGGNIGSMVMVTPDNFFEMAIKNVALFKQYVYNEIQPWYLFYFLKAQVDRMKAIAKGGAQMFVSLKLLRSHPFPLPPLAEQKRIVARLEELLAVCKKLK